MESQYAESDAQIKRLIKHLNERWNYEFTPMAYSLFNNSQAETEGDYIEYRGEDNIVTCSKSDLELFMGESYCDPTVNYLEKVKTGYYESKMQKQIFDSLSLDIMETFCKLLKEANYITDYDPNPRHPYEYYVDIIDRTSTLYGRLESNLIMQPITIAPFTIRGVKFGMVGYIEFSLWVKKRELRFVY